MTKKRTLHLIILLLTTVCALAQAEVNNTSRQYYPVRDRMEVTSLDGTWQFRLDGETGWRDIRVPGNWETQGVKVPEYGRTLSNMTGHYRRTFVFQEEWRGKEVILRLDGVQNGFTAFVNGHEAGSGHSGHTMHQFVVTPYLKEGRNEISIDVTTQSDYWLFDVCDAWSVTGIQHSVEMFAVPKEGNLADVIFSSRVNADNSADITIKVKANTPAVQGEVLKVTASLLDERYNHVADMQGTVQGDTALLLSHMQHPRLWNAETPNLYRLNVKLLTREGRLLQSITEKVGIREVRVEDCKILLNNREIFLRGACLSENDAIEGSAMTQLNRRKQLEQMKQANINFIRTAHYPLDPIVNRLCDEMGFYVCEEIPFASRGEEYLKRNDAAVIAELKARAKATIDRDRNSPSIIMWSHGNENHIYPPQDSVLLFTKNYDPTRLRGVPQAKGAFLSFIKKPSKYVDVICGHYANDGVLADACKYSTKPIINTEYAHSVGTSFGDLEHKYDIFRREPKIAGGSVWAFQDQAILTRNFNQQNQVLKGVRVDSVRYIDCYGLNPVPEGMGEAKKEGTDGVVYGDGYPQEDYFELAQVYSPVSLEGAMVNGQSSIVNGQSSTVNGQSSTVNGQSSMVNGQSSMVNGQWSMVNVRCTNLHDFISLHGYSIQWQLRHWQQVMDEDTVYLSAKAHETETVTIPINPAALQAAKSDGEGSTRDLLLCMKVVRPDGSLCYERNITLNDQGDYREQLCKAKGAVPTMMRNWLKEGFMLRVGRQMSVNLDYRRNRYWFPYLLEATNLNVKKQNGAYRITCRWQRDKGQQKKNYIDGEITMRTDKLGTLTIDYTLTPSDSINRNMLDYGLAFTLPEEYAQVAWLGQGPFSHTPDKTAYNNRDTWQLHRDDIRFDGNRGEVDIMSVHSPQGTIALCTDSRNIHLERQGKNIVLTDNLIVGIYGTKFTSPSGIDANKLGVQKGRITIKAFKAKDANDLEWLESIFGPQREVNPEQPYMESYGR